MGESLFWLPVATILAVAWAEGRWPRQGCRSGSIGIPLRRWRINATLYGCNLALTLALTLTPVAVALLAQQRGWGLLNALAAPAWLAYPASLLVADLTQYAAHRLSHTALLWPFHAVHHSDEQMDWSTSLRHHPVELLVALVLHGAVTAALGAPPPAVALYGALALAMSAFAHAAVRPPGLLRADPAAARRATGHWLFGPATHALHHAPQVAAGSRNFGEMLTLWDRLFGTYRAAPSVDGAEPRFGLSSDDPMRGMGRAGALSLMAMPLRRRTGTRHAP